MHAESTRAPRVAHNLPTLYEVLVACAEAGPVRTGAAVLVVLVERTPDGPERDRLVSALRALAPDALPFASVEAEGAYAGEGRAERMAEVRAEVERRAAQP
jgi:hypothetical protein